MGPGAEPARAVVGRDSPRTLLRADYAFQRSPHLLAIIRGQLGTDGGSVGSYARRVAQSPPPWLAFTQLHRGRLKCPITDKADLDHLGWHECLERLGQRAQIVDLLARERNHHVANAQPGAGRP